MDSLIYIVYLCVRQLIIKKKVGILYLLHRVHGHREIIIS